MNRPRWQRYRDALSQRDGGLRQPVEGLPLGNAAIVDVLGAALEEVVRQFQRVLSRQRFERLAAGMIVMTHGACSLSE